MFQVGGTVGLRQLLTILFGLLATLLQDMLISMTCNGMAVTVAPTKPMRLQLAKEVPAAAVYGERHSEVRLTNIIHVCMPRSVLPGGSAKRRSDMPSTAMAVFFLGRGRESEKKTTQEHALSASKTDVRESKQEHLPGP